jgi:DNA-binding XRE family transcriptional regulator
MSKCKSIWINSQALKNESQLFCIVDMKIQSPYIPLMALRGVTQKEIAALLDVTENTVSNWFTGKTTPRLELDEWFALAELLGTTIDRLPRSFAPTPIEKLPDRHA